VAYKVEHVYEPKWPLEAYTRVPQSWMDWFNIERMEKDRPRTLCVVGPSRMGKTEWARCLGKHVHMGVSLNIAR